MLSLPTFGTPSGNYLPTCQDLPGNLWKLASRLSEPQVQIQAAGSRLLSSQIDAAPRHGCQGQLSQIDTSICQIASLIISGLQRCGYTTSALHNHLNPPADQWLTLWPEEGLDIRLSSWRQRLTTKRPGGDRTSRTSGGMENR